MFAQRKKINVFHYHHVAVVFLELGRIQNFFRVFGVSRVNVCIALATL